jgi:hypothetical protein
VADLQSLEREVFETIQKADDLEVKVSKVTFDGREYAEIREYVPSLNEYGRGILISRSHAHLAAQALLEISNVDDD